MKTTQPSPAMKQAIHRIAVGISRRFKKAPEPIKYGSLEHYKKLTDVLREENMKLHLRSLNAERMSKHYQEQSNIARTRLSDLHELIQVGDFAAVTDECNTQREIMQTDEA